MGRSRVRLDRKALAKASSKNLAGLVESKAGAIRDAAQQQVPSDVPVGLLMKVDKMGSPVGLVTIMHPSGLARQARDGVLTRAAAYGGLDVTRS